MSIGNFDTQNITKQTTILSWLTWLLTAALFVWGFLVPPKGVIDDSVLQAACIVFGMLGLIVAREAIKEGFGAKISHGQTTMEFKDMDGDQSDE